MNLLAIDTSTDCASVALIVNGELHCEEQGAQRSHARLILPMIEGLLAKAGFGLSQLDGIAYGQGPGSFTGLRIACSVAKGLAYAQDLPLYPVSSLAAIANEAFQEEVPRDATVLAVLDARMNQLYWAPYQQAFDQVEEQVSAASDILIASSASPLVLAGVGYETYVEQFSSELQARLSRSMTIYPKAQAMIRLVLTGAIQPVSIAEALPVYIRNQITQGEPRG